MLSKVLTISCVAPQRREIVSEAHKAALIVSLKIRNTDLLHLIKANIGVESTRFHRILPINKPFLENLSEAKNKLKIEKFAQNPTLKN